MLYLGGGIPLPQLEPLDESLLQQKPNVNAVATLEKVIEIQSEPLGGTWGVLGGGWGAPGGLPSLCRGGGAQKGASHGGRESREGMGGDNTQGSPGLSLVSQGVFIVWEGSLPTGGGVWSCSGHGGPRMCPQMWPLSCLWGFWGSPGLSFPWGVPSDRHPALEGSAPPAAPPSCPCVWGSQQGLGGVPRSIPWGFLGSSALPFPLRCPVVSPHMGYGRPPVCPWRGGLGEGGVLRSVPLMGSWEWGGSPSLSLQ